MANTMQGKICIVTGASNGIGKETAKQLAALGAQVVLVCRNAGRGQAAIDEIASATGNHNLSMELCDLSALHEVKNLADTLLLKYPRIDVLINNAGGFFMKKQYSADGLEMNFALNYLTPFYLTNRLLPALEAAPQGRIIIISSEMEKHGKIVWDDLQFEHRSYNGLAGYGQAKLMVIIYTQTLAKKLKNTNVTINAVHPGGVASNFGTHDNNWLYRLGWMVTKWFFIPVEKGAETPVYLASSSEASDKTGLFWSEKKVRQYNPAADTPGIGEKLWEVSDALLKKLLPQN